MFFETGFHKIFYLIQSNKINTWHLFWSSVTLLPQVAFCGNVFYEHFRSNFISLEYVIIIHKNSRMLFHSMAILWYTCSAIMLCMTTLYFVKRQLATSDNVPQRQVDIEIERRQIATTQSKRQVATKKGGNNLPYQLN